jgi:hypothetical protein
MRIGKPLLALEVRAGDRVSQALATISARIKSQPTFWFPALAARGLSGTDLASK